MPLRREGATWDDSSIASAVESVSMASCSSHREIWLESRLSDDRPPNRAGHVLYLLSPADTELMPGDDWGCHGARQGAVADRYTHRRLLPFRTRLWFISMKS